jgi:hypothetical protein
MTVNGRRAEIPAAPYTVEWEDAEFPPAPMLGERG